MSGPAQLVTQTYGYGARVVVDIARNVGTTDGRLPPYGATTMNAPASLKSSHGPGDRLKDHCDIQEGSFPDIPNPFHPIRAIRIFQTERLERSNAAALLPPLCRRPGGTTSHHAAHTSPTP